jgi:hypothetical protein
MDFCTARVPPTLPVRGTVFELNKSSGSSTNKTLDSCTGGNDGKGQTEVITDQHQKFHVEP